MVSYAESRFIICIFIISHLPSRRPPSSTHPLQNREPPFQHLQLLVRDWPYFDDDTFDDPQVRARYQVGGPPNPSWHRWPTEMCEAQFREHLDQHFGEDIKERDSVDTVTDMFKQVSCFLLPTPGLKVAESKKRKWTGQLEDIDEDFLRFVDRCCEGLFGGSEVLVQKVLGQDLGPDSFVEVVCALTDAFAGMEVSAMSMVDAIGKVGSYWRCGRRGYVGGQHHQACRREDSVVDRRGAGLYSTI